VYNEPRAGTTLRRVRPLNARRGMCERPSVADRQPVPPGDPHLLIPGPVTWDPCRPVLPRQWSRTGGSRRSRATLEDETRIDRREFRRYAQMSRSAQGVATPPGGRPVTGRRPTGRRPARGSPGHGSPAHGVAGPPGAGPGVAGPPGGRRPTRCRLTRLPAHQLPAQGSPAHGSPTHEFPATFPAATGGAGTPEPHGLGRRGARRRVRRRWRIRRCSSLQSSEWVPDH
jgi:hypothetical protein